MSIRIETLLNKGYKAIEEGKYTEAVSFLEKAIEVEPKNAELYAYLGEAYFFAKEYCKAEQAFEKRKELILKDTFLSSEVQGYQGCIYLELGKFKEAKKLLQASISQNAQSPQIYYSMATLLIAENNLKEAEQYLKKIDKLDPFFYYRKIRDLRKIIKERYIAL
ncbi:MAG TPA: tetratricopeptide repeat protein [Planctomycetota bacterium]|nr:tetratricopeptide repeat protein [Planctomycetota bacterium]HRU50630.1 tetratricopeptide repeat protein [Planctomycetota bacterium]